MKVRDLITKRNIVVAAAALVISLAVVAYFALRRPTLVPMERYAPGDALAFVEIDNLADVVDGLTDTKAWRELAPMLGLSSQIRQIGRAADLMSRTGIGPEEAVIAGRAQYAIALTGIEAETGATAEGPYLHLKPRFAFIVETHASPDAAARLVSERTSIIANRIYGQVPSEETEDYFGTRLLIFHGPGPERRLIAASTGTVVLVANHASAIKSCLDAIVGRAETLAANRTLKERRAVVDQGAPIFAFITESGIEKLVELGPAIFASRFTTDPDQISLIANLFGHLSKQTAAGLLYSSDFAAGGVTEKYLTVLRPQVAAGLAEPLKAAGTADFESLQFVPSTVEDFTVLDIERVGELPDRLLKQLSPRLDLVAAVALREFVESFRKGLGLDATDSIANAVGSEALLVRFSDAEPMMMLVRVKDRSHLLVHVARYLTKDGAKVSTETYNGVEISVSTNEEGRAAAFVKDFLILGTRDQIVKSIDTEAAGSGIASDERLKQVLSRRPISAAVISYRREVTDAGEMMLAISKLTRVSDGARDLLEQESMRAALERLPRSVSFTEFRDYGIYTETRSAVGSFSLIGSLIGTGGEGSGQ